MKISAFQIRGSDDINENLLALKRGIAAAAQANARLLLTQECALCGYPPVETSEIAMFCISANSLSGFQTAPTCVINPDGIILQSAPGNDEYLLTCEVELDKSSFGRDGRIKHSRELIGN